MCLAILTLLAIAAPGCDNKGYKVVEVSGLVTLDGQPVPGSVVNFQPIADGSDNVGPGSTGRCDEQGRYTLMTIHDEPGAVVGRHRIRIVSYSPESPVVGDSDARGTPKEKFPTKYNYQTTLEFEVPAAGTDQANFELTSK